MQEPDSSSAPPTSAAESAQAASPPLVRTLSARLFGDPQSVELERRLFAGVMLVALLSGVCAAVQTVVIGNGPRMLAPAVAASVASLLGWRLARTAQEWRRLVVPFFVLILAILAASWITEAGTGGTIAFYFFLTACYAAIFFNGRARAVAVGAVLATVAGLSIVERFFPSVILPYDSPNKRFVDIVFTLLLCLFMLAFFVYRVFGEYQRERAAKDDILRVATAEKDRALRSLRVKQRLLSIVSHDIANALTLLRGEIELSRMPARNGVVGREALERMDYACGTISEIIGTVRMMEAVEQGRMTFEPKRVDLQAVFKTAEMLFADRLLKQNIRIVFPELSDDTRYVLADQRIVANHVFSNLISNAIKFSHRDSTIVVSVERDGKETVMRIADRGIGMSPDLVRKLFDLDAKSTRPGTDGSPGTGLGMHTVKSFLDLLGGTITVESKPEEGNPSDHGTTVSVRLPSFRSPE